MKSHTIDQTEPSLFFQHIRLEEHEIRLQLGIMFIGRWDSVFLIQLLIILTTYVYVVCNCYDNLWKKRNFKMKCMILLWMQVYKMHVILTFYTSLGIVFLIIKVIWV